MTRECKKIKQTDNVDFAADMRQVFGKYYRTRLSHQFDNFRQMNDAPT